MMVLYLDRLAMNRLGTRLIILATEENRWDGYYHYCSNQFGGSIR